MGLSMIHYDQIAALGYEAYGASTNWKNFQGNPMPRWEELPVAIQEAWIAAARKIVTAHTAAAVGP